MVYTVSYTTDQHEQMAIRVTSEPDLIIEVSFTHNTMLDTSKNISLVNAEEIFNNISALFVCTLLYCVQVLLSETMWAEQGVALL